MRKSMRYLSPFMILVLAACGGGDAPDAGDQPAADAAPAPEAAAAVDMDLPEGVTPAMVAQGDAVFGGAGICFTCHMQGGVGGPLAPNLTDDQWLNTDGSYDGIVSTVTTGVSEPREHPGIMLPKGGTAISDDEVRAVAAYVWTLSTGG